MYMYTYVHVAEQRKHDPSLAPQEGARTSRFVHPNLFVATRHPSPSTEPRDLADSSEDPAGMYPGDLPGHVMMYTFEMVHTLGGPTMEEEVFPHKARTKALTLFVRYTDMAASHQFMIQEKRPRR